MIGVMVFTVSEKQIKARDGVLYDLSNYILGTDYVVRRAFRGEKRMFRKGILADSGHPESIELSVVDPSLVEHKQDAPPIEVALPAPTDQVGEAADMVKDEPVIIQPSQLDDCIRTAKVVKRHHNQRYVETDTLGRVYVGEKGHQIKLQQLIRVKNGLLVVS